MNILFILNDAPGVERSMSALRLACALSMRSSIYVRIFLLGAAAACALRDRDGRGHPGDAATLVHAVILRGGDVRVCGPSLGQEGACAPPGELLEGAVSSSLEELARWIPEADRLLVF